MQRRRGLVVERRAGRLLDDLLVAALDRALALVEVHDPAVSDRRRSAPRRGGTVRRSARRSTVPSPKADSASRGRPATALEQLVGRRHDAHAPPAAAGRRLDQQRDSPPRRRRPRPRRRPDRSARPTAAAGPRHRPSAAWPRASSPSPRSPRATARRTPGPASATARANGSVLGQEPVAGMDGVGPGARPRPRAGRRRAGRTRPASPRRWPTARSASWTKAASASASENTATVSMPRSRQVRMMRRAISPRLATSSRSIMGPLTSGTRRSRAGPGTRW